ncbi:unnamed protein product [Parnassius apollo]|uniref:(apollo) hypothetical protein n=1 Tax=Parnassius apollo TaxID=110799 RepID=A0A8S3W1C0_PARAO|nr:unnamed protein product [Parnassius apollo]
MMFDQLFICFLGITVVSGSHHVNFFRRDYTFLEKYNAFYKLHRADNSGTWNEAFLACDDEGASFFYPKDVNEWKIARNLSDSPDVEEIFVGVHDELGRGDLLSFDGHFLPEFSVLHISKQNNYEPKCVIMSVHTGNYSIDSCKIRRPFICKKKANESCPTVDSGYIYSKTTNKCYKVHNRREATWEDAMHTCYMEGGILSTGIDSSELHDILNMITEGKQFFMGFRRIMPQNSFYSVRGEKVSKVPTNEENCCAIQMINERDNYNNYNRNIYYFTQDCNNTLPFICELDVKL